jgi:hypothetical protein
MSLSRCPLAAAAGLLSILAAFGAFTPELQAHAALTKRIYRLTFDLDRQVMSVCYFDGDVCRLEILRFPADGEK